tara:strand:- start:10147 stop:10887 length:741 start_codon:yes stop_codon:yes gene_type:complete
MKKLLWHGDCLEKMKSIPGKLVDLVLTDPPYGTTACKWDSIIDLDLMWEQLNRIIKPNGAIVLFGSEPFSSALRMSNIKNYKYDWVWEKNRPVGYMNAKSRPMKTLENIVVFCNVRCDGAKNLMTYNPQGLIDVARRMFNSASKRKGVGSGIRSSLRNKNYIQKKTNYPTDVLEFIGERGLHPTQKPVELMEYLIKTYTNENETVLDFTMGSGSTGVACKNLNRKFIGIEIEEKYFNIAKERIEKA